MDIQALINIISEAGKSDRANNGQASLKYLRDMLSGLDPDMPCQYDTGDNFGNSHVEFTLQEASEHWDEYYSASSNEAFPSCYRGYYSDVTFNASPAYELSTVGYVLDLAEQTIGKSFSGYKGGEYRMTEGTLVWGGSTSHSDTANEEMVTGVIVKDGICIIQTDKEEI